jgi:hypothetical protein
MSNEEPIILDWLRNAIRLRIIHENYIIFNKMGQTITL